MATEGSVDIHVTVTSDIGEGSTGHNISGDNDDEDDEFAGILVETNSSPRDGNTANLAAVNYKVSMEEYEKVDLFQTSPVSALEKSPCSHEAQDGHQQIIEQENHQCDMQNTHQPVEPTMTHNRSSAIHLSPTSLHHSEDLSFVICATKPDSLAEEQLIMSDEQRVSPCRELSEHLLKTQAEWDAVGTIQPAGSTIQAPGKYGPASDQTPSISFNEILAYFQTRDMTEYMSKIKPTVERSGWVAIRHFILGPPKIKPSLHEERNLLFAIAQSPFDDSEAIHKRVLQTIYKQLTGSTIDCPRFGTHWEQIGFQGNDPSTDLRACGFLALMTLLQFLRDPDRLALAKEIYRLSVHETQNFPFCVMSINMTRISLQALREGHLSRECNRRKQVLGVVNDFYTGIFLMLYQVWKQQRKTIIDSGFVIQDIETNAKKNPREVIRCLEEYLKDKKSSGNNSVTSKNIEVTSRGDAFMEFAGVHELDNKKEEIEE